AVAARGPEFSVGVCLQLVERVPIPALWFSGSSKVNLVRIPSTASSPRDTALAAVICSALATVLLALLTLCVIYCKRQCHGESASCSSGELVSLTHLLPPAGSLRTQDPRYQGSELSCFDRPRLSTSAPRVCCQCHRDSPATCGPVHLTASGCCDGVCIVGRETPGCRVHSKAAHQERSVCGEFSDAWPLMQNPSCGDDISSCDSYAGLTGEDVPSLSLEDGSPSSLDPSGRRGLVGEAAPIPDHLEDLTETTDLPRHSNSLPEPVLTQDVLSARSQRGQEREDPLICPPTHPTRCSSDGLQWAQR
ncbi:Tumor necrosis factor receptor superfamily member 19, partial [Camelus dromedarius]